MLKTTQGSKKVILSSQTMGIALIYGLIDTSPFLELIPTYISNYKKEVIL